MKMTHSGLHAVDWIVFAIGLVLSCFIGTYHSFTGGKQRTTREYLSGGDTIGVIPATLSLTVSFISSILILSFPAEIYVFGGQHILNGVGYALGYLLSAFLFVPVLYPLRTITANEYVELRFRSRALRNIIGMYTISQSILYAAIVAFGQATATEAVSGFPVWATIIIAMVVAVTYTTLGGLRGVIWSDVFQAAMMFGGLIVALTMALVRVGRLSTVFKHNKDWGRLKIFDFDPDPTKRYNFWGLIFACALTGSSIVGHRQAGYQRYAAMPTITKAKWVAALSGQGYLLLTILASFAGWAIFAYYTEVGCDPLKDGKISNPNQIVPYFVGNDVNVPGLTGFFLASVTAGALSTVSSILNGAAAIAWSDMIKPHVNVSDGRATVISKCLVAGFGVIVIVLALFVERLGGTMTQMFGVFSGSLVGPVAGVFLLGMFIPWGNWKGAAVGCLMGTIVPMWIGFGSYTIDRHLSRLPTNTANCTTTAAFNTTLETSMDMYSNYTMEINTMDESENFTGINRLYALSYLWIREVAVFITIFVAVVVSFLTGKSNPLDIEPRLLHPCIRGFFVKTNAKNVEIQEDVELEENEHFLSKKDVK